jgi:hypothetical protein
MFGKVTALNAEATEQDNVSLQDMRTLSEAELDAVAGGSPALGSLIGNATGQAVNGAVGQLVKEAGYPK